MNFKTEIFDRLYTKDLPTAKRILVPAGGIGTKMTNLRLILINSGKMSNRFTENYTDT